MGSTMRTRRDHPRAVVLVEGVSDQLALEALAERRGRNLAAEGVSIVPIGGAHAIEEVIDAHGELGTFRTLQKQPAWRGRPTEAQLRRWLGSQSRKTTVRSLVRALAP